MKKEKMTLVPERLGKVGGQAVLEGVMMKSGDLYCLAVRKEDGTIGKMKDSFISARKKHKICNIPLLRGVINFVEMLSLSMKTLTKSADMLGIDEAEAETKFEKWLKDKVGDKLMGILVAISSVIGVALALGLFVFLPTWITKLIKTNLWPDMPAVIISVIEGVVKISLFVAYIALVGLMPDIKRTFEYHGAEHKSVACYEAGLDLVPENARKCTRFHPRCGTSFIFVMLILSILIGMFIGFRDMVWLRTLTKLLLLPLTVGLGFEFIMYAGKHNNILTKILSAPGLWMQRLTTKEPDDSQLEVAITALKGAMPEQFPEEDEPSVSDEKPADEKTEDEEKDGKADENDA